MAFQNDFTEEELQRALEAAGGTGVVVNDGPGPGTGGATTVGGPAVPAGTAPAAAGGQQGTGFVNLANYFNANTDGAARSAQGLIDPLKQDLAPIGQAAADQVPLPSSPTHTTPRPLTETDYAESTLNEQGEWTTPAGPGAEAAAQDTTNQTAYEAQLASAKDAQEKARANAIESARTANVEKGRSYLTDPNNIRAGLSSGQDASAFDTYLTGAAMPNAYQGLWDYYGGAGTPGRSGGGYGRPAPEPIPEPAAPPTGGELPILGKNRGRRNEEGW